MKRPRIFFGLNDKMSDNLNKKMIKQNNKVVVQLPSVQIPSIQIPSDIKELITRQN